jgi:hypothetical protein
MLLVFRNIIIGLKILYSLGLFVILMSNSGYIRSLVEITNYIMIVLDFDGGFMYILFELHPFKLHSISFVGRFDP